MKAKVTTFVMFVLVFTLTFTALGQGQYPRMAAVMSGNASHIYNGVAGGGGNYGLGQYCPWCQALTKPCVTDWKPPVTDQEAAAVSAKKDPYGLFQKSVQVSQGIPVVVGESVLIGQVQSYYGGFFGNMGVGGAGLSFPDPIGNLQTEGQRTMMEILRDDGYAPHAPLTGLPDAQIVHLEGSAGAKECAQIRAAKFVFLSAFGIQSYGTQSRVLDLERAGQIAMRFVKSGRANDIIAAITQGTGTGSVRENMGIEAHVWIYTPDLGFVAHGTASAVFEDTLLSEMTIAGVFSSSSRSTYGYLTPGAALTRCALRRVKEDERANCDDLLTKDGGKKK